MGREGPNASRNPSRNLVDVAAQLRAVEELAAHMQQAGSDAGLGKAQHIGRRRCGEHKVGPAARLVGILHRLGCWWQVMGALVTTPHVPRIDPAGLRRGRLGGWVVGWWWWWWWWCAGHDRLRVRAAPCPRRTSSSHTLKYCSGSARAAASTSTSSASAARTRRMGIAPPIFGSREM